MQLRPGDPLSEKDISAEMCGTSGAGPASELSSFVRMAINLPSYEQVISDPAGTVLPTKPDQIYAMVMLMAVRAKVQDADNVIQYITRFTANHAITGIVSLVRRDRNFALSKNMRNWILSNKEMLAKFGRYITEAV